jgi:hypothetical protein
MLLRNVDRRLVGSYFPFVTRIFPLRQNRGSSIGSIYTYIYTFLTLPGLELRALGCPVRSQSLYRLRYPLPHTPSWCSA